MSQWLDGVSQASGIWLDLYLYPTRTYCILIMHLYNYELLNTPGTSKHVYKVYQKITTWQHFHVISCFGFINFCSIGPLK